MDEHRMGLRPIHRRQWCFPEQTKKEIFIGYKWLWVYGFVEPSTGENHHYLGSHFNKVAFEVMLKTFAKNALVSVEKPVLLILDQAAAHQSLHVPSGVHLHYLPPYSPELQPAERLWPTLNEIIANHLITSTEELWERVKNRCLWMMTQGKEFVQGLTNFHWWPKQNASTTR